MTKILFLDLRYPPFNEPQWFDGHTTHMGDLALLRKQATRATVIAIIPSEIVSFCAPKLPKMRRSRLLQALPFVIEEQLSQPLSTVHLAIGTQTAEGTVPTYILAKEKMHCFSEALQRFQLTRVILIPLTLALPYRPNTWYLHYANPITLRTGLFTGFACDPDNLHTYLALALQTETPPQTIAIYNDTAQTIDPATWSLPPAISCPLITHHEETLFKQFSPSLMTPINLLQGPYALHTPHRFSHCSWKPAIGLFLTMIGLSLFTPLVSAYLKHTHPVASLPTQPPAPQQPVLTVLSMIGNHTFITANLAIQHLAIHHDQCVLQIRSTNEEDLTRFKASLIQKGLRLLSEQNQQTASYTIARWVWQLPSTLFPVISPVSSVDSWTPETQWDHLQHALTQTSFTPRPTIQIIRTTETMTILFKQMPFDQWIVLLTQWARTYPIHIQTFSVTPITNVSGLVNGRLRLAFVISPHLRYN